MITIVLVLKSIQIALPLCMDSENSFLFLSNSVSTVTSIHQLTITGEYLRSIELENYLFLRISSLIFDSYDQQLVIVDSFNSIFYSVDPDLDEQNAEILLKHSDNVNCPQRLCVGNEGHLIIVELYCDNIECQNQCSIDDLSISIDFNSTTLGDSVIIELFHVNRFI
jgi:hypothetical protein